jgi:hypothetical protein
MIEYLSITVSLIMYKITTEGIVFQFNPMHLQITQGTYSTKLNIDKTIIIALVYSLIGEKQDWRRDEFMGNLILRQIQINSKTSI